MLRTAWLCLTLLLSIVSASAQTPPDSRLKPIIDQKTIRIAYRTDATPFAFTNDQKQPTGFSVEHTKPAN
jgi:hypothetical protein